MFDADRPISKSEQDQLGRTEFAKYLARCILDHKSPASLAVGLYGGWGSGKTSVINLAIEEMHYAFNNLLDEDKPLVLNFSPWSYSGQNQIIYSFYRHLSAEVRRFPHFDNAERIIHLLELYVSYFTHRPVPNVLRPKHNFLANLFSPRVKEEAYAWESGRDLTQIKAELNALLSKQKHKIIIIIDNISRLEPKEMNQIFQIVKAMGDFAHTVYLLAMDKELAADALDQIHHGNGHEFLEKIIQLPFAVPPISAQDIQNLLFAQLDKVIRLVPNQAWNSHYWADIYYVGLKYFFSNCRDITRYINTLSFSYPRVRDVVHPVDYFALTALQVFLPDVYEGIHTNKDLFTDLLDNVYQLDKENIKKDRLRCDEVLARNDKVPAHILRNLLIRMFPRLRSIYETTGVFYHSEMVARKNKRICSPDLFDEYFKLSLPSNYIPEPEFLTILALANNAVNFSQALSRLTQDEKVVRFLDLLDGNDISKVPEKNVRVIINALFDDGDLFPEGKANAVSFTTPMRIHRICHQLLGRIKNPAEKFTMLQEAIRNANKSLYISIYEILAHEEEHQISDEEDTYVPMTERDISPQQLEGLKKLAVTKIEQWAKNGRLADHPKLAFILEAWHAWDSSEACQRYVLTLSKEDKTLLAFLTAMLREPIAQAMSTLRKFPDWGKYIERINVLIPTTVLAPRVKALFEDLSFEKLSETEQLGILIFLDLTKVPTKKIIPKTTI